MRVLHFAPEKRFKKFFTTLPNLTYVGADLRPNRAMVVTDITDAAFKGESFDVILCSHVLEHVTDDRRAMNELFRVLKSGGWAIIQSPTDPGRDQTFEDPEILLPEDRERVFGHSDHVRIYGKDYQSRLEGAGFTVRMDTYARDLEPETIERYGLKRTAEICFCTKS